MDFVFEKWKKKLIEVSKYILIIQKEKNSVVKVQVAMVLRNSIHDLQINLAKKLKMIVTMNWSVENIGIFK